MLDAFNLAQLIINRSQQKQQDDEKSQGLTDYPHLLKEYEGEMLPRGRQAVLDSREAVFWVHRPIEAWRSVVLQSKL